MTAKNLKRGLLLAGLLVGALILVCSTQQWFSVSLTESKGVSVGGDVAAPALAVLGLTTMVLVSALAIAGPFFRVVLGILEIALGGTVLLSAILAIANPAAVAASIVTKATGVTGTESITALILEITPTAWPFIAVVSGLLLVLVGLAVIVTGRVWPGSSRKYSAVRLEDPENADDPSGAWDALSGGGDPTDRNR